MSTNVSIAELRGALESARQERDRALQARDFKRSAAAGAVLLKAERALAAAEHEPHAVPVAFPLPWDAGAPLPHLLQNDNRALLVFILSDAEDTNHLGVVEFQRCICTKMGTPNDEVFHGHPLSGKGLELYCALEVKNSRWISELEAVNAVHRSYRAERWRDLKHYIFGFHDCTFECVAEGFSVDRRVATIRDVLTEFAGKFAE